MWRRICSTYTCIFKFGIWHAYQSYDYASTCTIKRTLKSISGSCLSEPGECPGIPLIALGVRTNRPTYRLFEITFKPRSYPTSINEGTTVVIFGGIDFCSFKSCAFGSPRNPMMVDNETIIICTVRLPTVLWYIDGTTPKDNLSILV